MLENGNPVTPLSDSWDKTNGVTANGNDINTPLIQSLQILDLLFNLTFRVVCSDRLQEDIWSSSEDDASALIIVHTDRPPSGRWVWRHFNISHSSFTWIGSNNHIKMRCLQKICSAHISTLLGAQGANPETPGQAPLLFHDKCPGFFYVHHTTRGTYSFTSHPKDEAIMVKCLAQGHKRCDRPGRDHRTHILTTPESNALDRSAMTVDCSVHMFWEKKIGICDAYSSIAKYFIIQILIFLPSYQFVKFIFSRAILKHW